MLTQKQIEAIHRKATEQVKVSCCEMHQHTAEDGCLSGPPYAITICSLCENLLNTRRQLQEVQKLLAELLV